MPKILALDLARKTGWASSDGAHGLFLLPDGVNGFRWQSFEGWLEERLEVHPTDWVVCEASLHQPGAAGRMANALHTIVEMCCWRNGCAYKKYAAGTIKKHATGSGRATKTQMWEAAVARGIEFTPETDDVVDALWLLDLALSDL